MKKKMERLSDELFRPLTPAEQRRTFGGATQTAVTAYETANPNPDFARDGDHE
ncbi:MAG: hypothetical protein ACJ76N_26425 [Thermoanaerobaculia bacterium]